MLALLQVPRVDVPKGSAAEGLLREARSFQEPRGRAALGRYGDLRRHLLPAGDAEARVWGGFGLSYLEGIVLRRRAGRWTAVRLRAGYREPIRRGRDGSVLTPLERWSQPYAAPKGGWPAFWRKAEGLGLWTLPDESTLPQKGHQQVDDGFSYLVEIQRDGVYRAYYYDNPQEQRQWPEAGRMVRLGNLLDLAFPTAK